MGAEKEVRKGGVEEGNQAELTGCRSRDCQGLTQPPTNHHARSSEALAACLETSPRPVTVRTTAQPDLPDHQGARVHGLSGLRAAIISRA
jgi:hypothetical protein